MASGLDMSVAGLALGMAVIAGPAPTLVAQAKPIPVDLLSRGEEVRIALSAAPEHLRDALASTP